MSAFDRTQEERDFTNPHVRFRRIRGKIVPIYNKKRIGQTISDTGEKVAGVGALAVGGAMAMKAFGLDKKLFGISSKISALSALRSKTGDGFKLKTVKTGIRFGGSSAKFMMKHPVKAGLSLMLGGLAIKAIGDDTQMDSKFGKDYFLIHDKETGMGS